MQTNSTTKKKKKEEEEEEKKRDNLGLVYSKSMFRLA